MTTTWIEMTDRETGEVGKISSDTFAKRLQRLEDPRVAEEVYANVVCAGGSYRTAGFDYRKARS